MLAPVWRPEPTPVDAENAPDIVASVVDEVRVDNWDTPLLWLPLIAVALLAFLRATRRS